MNRGNFDRDFVMFRSRLTGTRRNWCPGGRRYCPYLFHSYGSAIGPSSSWGLVIDLLGSTFNGLMPECVSIHHFRPTGAPLAGSTNKT